MVPWKVGQNHCRRAIASGSDTGQLPHSRKRPPAWLIRAVLSQHDQRGKSLQVADHLIICMYKVGKKMCQPADEKCKKNYNLAGICWK